MECRVPTFLVTSPGLTPLEAASRLAGHGFAVWHGDYYAVEVMRRLGLPEGGLRIGLVHYNTVDEVDRLLAELRAL
jgi:selenocysteine lyase/cysteine desulfurase